MIWSYWTLNSLSTADMFVVASKNRIYIELFKTVFDIENILIKTDATSEPGVDVWPVPMVVLSEFTIVVSLSKPWNPELPVSAWLGIVGLDESNADRVIIFHLSQCVDAVELGTEHRCNEVE